MACFAGCDVAVHEIQVATERTIKECCSIWCGLAASDECRKRLAAELVGQFPNGTDYFCIEGANGHPNRIEHADFQLLRGLIAQVVKTGPLDKAGKHLQLRHGNHPTSSM